LDTKISGVFLIRQNVHTDLRGQFVKVFHKEIFNNLKLETTFLESYYSESKKGVIRGMHFQIPPKQHAKVTTIISGRIVDVILDLRRSSPTFKKFEVFELSREGHVSVYIPEGCAHGFMALEDQTIVSYMTSTVYSMPDDKGIRFDSFGYDWGVKNPILSPRDLGFPRLENFESPFV